LVEFRNVSISTLGEIISLWVVVILYTKVINRGDGPNVVLHLKFEGCPPEF
jgi:hypothetical protein